MLSVRLSAESDSNWQLACTEPSFTLSYRCFIGFESRVVAT